MRTKRVKCKVLLEGVDVSFNSISISESKNNPPVATISFPANTTVVQVLPKTICHVFWLDDGGIDDSKAENFAEGQGFNATYRLIFQGELSSYSIAYASSKREISLSFSGFTQNWHNYKVLPMDVSIPNSLTQSFMCVNYPDPNKPNAAAWQKIIFDKVSSTPLSNIAKAIQNNTLLSHALSAILEAIAEPGVYLAAMHTAFKILNQLYIYNDPSKAIDKIVQVQSVNQFIQNQIQVIDGESSVADTLTKLLDSFGYDFVELAAPAYVDGQIRRIFFKPKTDLFAPPLCNTVFDDDIIDLSFQRNIDQEPTRMLSQTLPSFLTGDDGLNAAIMSTVVPQGVILGSVTSNSKSEHQQNENILGLTMEEQCRGIVPSSNYDSTGIEFAYFLQAAQQAAASVGNTIKDPENYQEEIGKMGHEAVTRMAQKYDSLNDNEPSDEAKKLHAYQVNMAMTAYLDQKHAARVAYVDTPYTPYRLVGFPSLILTKYFLTLVGNIETIDSTISADGTASQHLTLSHVRTYNIDAVDAGGKVVPNPIITPQPDIVEDSFSNPPIWYEGFYSNYAKFYKEVTGNPDSSIIGHYKNLGFNASASRLKAAYVHSQLTGTAHAFITKIISRKIPSFNDWKQDWNNKLRVIKKGDIGKGTANVLWAIPWIKQRHDRVKEIFNYTGNMTTGVVSDEQIVTVTLTPEQR